MYSDNPKIQQLMALGQPERGREWPDYVAQYQLVTTDVPDLVALLEDDQQLSNNNEDATIWGPLHAWRALGQLGDNSAIGPIIDSFDTNYDDDAALEELCKVLAMFGAQAITPLFDYWQQPGKDEFAYVMAMDALSEIAKSHPDTRTDVLSVFRNYMADPEQALPILNGLLIGQLIDLKATELSDEIRRLFALECVDITCNGDVEDVEILLGLRDIRSTPKPDLKALYAAQDLAAEAPEPEDDDIFGLINYVLLKKGGDDAIFDVSELDGFFAAIACSPRMLMPSNWMPAIWGGEDQSPEWDSKEEYERFASALFAYYNMVIGGFSDDDYEPLYLEGFQDDELVLVVDAWCEGFMRGLCLWADSVPEADLPLLEECIAPIQLFTGAVDLETRNALPDSDIEILQESIYPAVLRLYRYFFKPVKRPNTTFIHASPKTGRNQPCPCGSGKKYKKCCGLN